MEKILIAQLDVETKGMRDRVVELQKEMTDYKIKMKDLKKATNNLSTATNEEIKQFTDLQTKTKALSKEYGSTQSNLIKVEQAQRANITTDNNAVKSKNQLRAELKLLYASRNQISGSDERSIALQKDLTSKINSHEGALKSNRSEEEKRIGNIGNYEQAVTSALEKSGLMNTSVGRAIIGLKTHRESLKSSITAIKAQTVATNGGTKSLKLFRLALISTGIGAIVVALGALAAGFLSTQRGADAVSKATRPLSVLMQKLWGVVQNLGTSFVDAFSNPKEAIANLAKTLKENILNRIEAIGLAGKAISKIFASGFTDGYKDLANAVGQGVTGVEDIVGKTQDLANEVKQISKDAITEGENLVSLQIEIENKEIALAKRRSELNLLSREQRQIAEDISRTEVERLQAAENASGYIQELVDSEREVIQLKINKAKLQASFNDTSREDLKEIATLEGQLSQVAIRAVTEETALLNKKNSIIQQAAAAQLKDLETELQIYKAQNAEKLESDNELNENILEARLAILQEIANREQKIAETQKILGQSTEKEYQLRIIEIQSEFKTQKQELQDELFNYELDKKNKIQAFELSFEETKLSKGKLNAEEKLAFELEKLEEEKTAKIAQAEELGLATQEIEQFYTNQSLELQSKAKAQSDKLEQDKSSAKIAQGQTAFNAIADTIGKETKIGKTAAKTALVIGQANAVSRIIQNTAEASTKAGAASPLTLGAPWNAILIASGAAQIAKVISDTKSGIDKINSAAIPTLYTGGKVLGSGKITDRQNVPTQKGGDNVLAFVKRGEVILNERQQQRAKNRFGPNIFGAIGVPGFNAGGQVGSVNNNISIDTRSINETIERALTRTVHVVPVQDVSSIQSNIKYAKARSNI